MEYTIHLFDADTCTIEWEDGRTMAIALGHGDAELIRNGANPVAERWEDGCGHLVCYENAQEAE